MVGIEAGELLRVEHRSLLAGATGVDLGEVDVDAGARGSLSGHPSGNTESRRHATFREVWSVLRRR